MHPANPILPGTDGFGILAGGLPSIFRPMDRLPAVRQQLVEPVDRVAVDAVEHIVEVIEGVDIVELAAGQE